MGRQSNRNAGEIRVGIERHWLLRHSMSYHLQLHSLYLNMLVIGHGDERLATERRLVLSAFERRPTGASHAPWVTQRKLSRNSCRVLSSCPNIEMFNAGEGDHMPMSDVVQCTAQSVVAGAQQGDFNYLPDHALLLRTKLLFHMVCPES
jgi:hypothetical protein